MTTGFETTTVLPQSVVQHDQAVVREMEQAHVNETFHQIVEDMGIGPETQGDPKVRAVLDLVASCWTETDPMPRAEAVAEREWLVEAALRAAGADSDFVRENGLTTYEADTADRELSRKAMELYGG